jgi:hypothetical protein
MLGNYMKRINIENVINRDITLRNTRFTLSKSTHNALVKIAETHEETINKAIARVLESIDYTDILKAINLEEKEIKDA